MAYANAAEIEADFKDMDFTDTSNVKTADVTQFIVEIDALINAYVGQVYTVPVASGDGLNLLKLICRSLVAERIKRIMKVVQPSNSDTNQNVLEVLLSPTKCMEILNDIKDKNIALAGAEPLVSGGGFFNKNVHCDVESVMKKDTKQW